MNSGPILILDDNAGIFELTSQFLRMAPLSSPANRRPPLARHIRRPKATSMRCSPMSPKPTTAEQLEIAVQLHALAPGLKVLIVSGYSFEDWLQTDLGLVNRLPSGSLRFLRKPFSAQQVLDAVGELLHDLPPEPRLAPFCDPPESLDSLFELSHDALIVRHLDGRIRYWNRAAETLYGWSRNQAIGQRADELLQTVYPAPLENIQATLLEKARCWEGELRHTASTSPNCDCEQPVGSSRDSLEGNRNSRDRPRYYSPERNRVRLSRPAPGTAVTIRRGQSLGAEVPRVVGGGAGSDGDSGRHRANCTCQRANRAGVRLRPG